MIEAQVLDELNVRSLEAAEDAAVVNVRLRPNLPILGPKYGKEIGRIKTELASVDPFLIAAKVKAGEPIEIAGFSLNPDEILVDIEELPGLAVALEDSIAVAIDTELTPELKLEGIAREIVHRLQELRKNANLDIKTLRKIFISFVAVFFLLIDYWRSLCIKKYGLYMNMSGR